MLKSDTNYKEDISKSSSTGETPPEKFKYVVVRFGKFDVTIKLTPTNEFITITEIAINKEFLSTSQAESRKGCLDVDDFYKE